MTPDGSGDPAVYTRRRLLVATAAVSVPILVYSKFGGSGVGSAPPASSMVRSSESTLVGVQPTSAATESSSVVAPPPLFDHDVGPGATGDKVSWLQDRLRALGFDPGPTDGVYGNATERAVWAYEKLILDIEYSKVTGTITPERWVRMNQPIEIRPRRSNPGTHLEVLLEKQVATLFVNDQVRLITHISSGTGEEWCDVVLIDNDDGSQTEKGICGVAVTPGGVFHFDRRVDGWRNSKLGRLYNPVYFNYGIAVHGASNVPSVPASHGCVRIPMHIAEYFPSLVRNGDLVYVFDGVEEPETYGAQVPPFDYPDPSYTTTTSSTSTTTLPAPTTTRATASTSTVVPAGHGHPSVTTSTTTSAPTPTTTEG